MQHFVSFEDASALIRGKRIAIVGSAPSVLDNEPGFVDGHDVVVRINNYKLSEAAGFRCDVHYSFYGRSIRKTADELKLDGVYLCLCKCPDSKPLQSEWHERNRKQNGIDFRYIYEFRKDWWFCPTWVPTPNTFIEKVDLLDRHIPTTGFAAILDVLACDPQSVFLTGFDFFSSGLHNVNEAWRPGNPKDPICHRPDLEAAWLAENERRFIMDAKMREAIERMCAVT